MTYPPTSSSGGIRWWFFAGAGFPCRALPLLTVNVTSYPRWLRSFSFALNQRKVLRTQKLDVMLGFGNVLEADVYQSHGGVQHIWMEREIASYQSTQASGGLRLCSFGAASIRRSSSGSRNILSGNRKYKRIVAISDMVRDHMSRHFGIRPDDFRVVFNGVDTVRFRPGTQNSVKSTKKILFSAGKFQAQGAISPASGSGENSLKSAGTFALPCSGVGGRSATSPLSRTWASETLSLFSGRRRTRKTVYAESEYARPPHLL